MMIYVIEWDLSSMFNMFEYEFGVMVKDTIIIS